MTNEERAALVERLRKYVFDDDDTDKAADQIEADGKRIGELEEAVATLNSLWSREFEAHNKTQERLIDLQKIVMARATLGEAP